MRKLLFISAYLWSFVSYSQTLGLQQFATGFTSAIELTHPANDSRLFVVQQGGLIRIVNPDGSINATPFLNVSSLISTGSERGLLGLAFHPNYANNGLFFINYTNTSGNTVIARYGVSADPNVANTTGTILMTINQPFSNHNGGTLRFGPDGYLYIGMGDGGGAGDTSGYAQNLDTAYPAIAANPTRIYLGKMLRIDVDTISGLLNYGIPPTNPFVGQAGKEEIWAYGVRNPWKFSFNRANGDLWIADVGQDTTEEIDKIPSPLPNTGLNFGWRCYEGNGIYSTSIGSCPAYASTVAPINQYTHASGRCSITGGYFYSGTSYPNFQNKYFFADFCTAEIGYINNAGALTWAYDAPNYLGSFGEDNNGELYVSINAAYSPTTASTIYKLVDTSLHISEFERNGFSLYPNPAKTEVFIKNKTDKAISKIKVFDLTGKLVVTKTCDNETNPSVTVTDLSKGLYMIAVEDITGSQYQSKLVVE